jgi:hypothetical protein
MLQFSLTSQVENPIIRNFVNTGTSKSFIIYNKAKSNGSLYRPGFAFEDRQYSIEIKNMAVFKSNSVFTASSAKLNPRLTCPQMCLPVLDSFDLKAVVGLPISLGKLLINGYVLEMNTPTSDLNLYLDNLSINLVSNLINENSSLIQCYDLSPKTNETKSNASATRTSLPGGTNHGQSDLEIVPLDILITAENVNICFYLIDKETGLKSALFWSKAIQPYACLIMHEKFQKLELSIFDFSLMRATPSSSESLLVQNDEFKVPVKHDFIMPVVETKQIEPDPKTGILASLFSFKVKNFGHLFGYTNKRLAYSTSSKNQTNLSSLLDLSNNSNQTKYRLHFLFLLFL